MGLWTKADAQTRFAGLRVTTTAQTMPQSCEDDQLPPTPAGQTWKLVWQDEFDGTKLDASEVGSAGSQASGRMVVPEGRRPGRRWATWRSAR